MAGSDRRDRLKTTALTVALILLAGWALWVTTPKPDLSSVVWESPFPASYVESHRGRVITEISESLELFNVLGTLARRGPGAQEAGDGIAAFLPYADHPAVSAVRGAGGNLRPQVWSGVFAYELGEDGLVRRLPHTLPPFEERLAVYSGALVSFASASGFRDLFREALPLYHEFASRLARQAEPDRFKEWLDAEFPAVSHDALRIVLSPFLHGEAFSHNFAGSEYSEIVIFLPAPGAAVVLREAVPPEGRAAGDPGSGGLLYSELYPEGEAFAQAAGHYVSRMTDRYIRIVNRVFSNLSIWRAGSLDDTPASIFNEYMAWSAYLLYARRFQEPEAYEKTARAVVARMNERGYVQFELLWNRILRLREGRGEPLGALFPRIIREAIQIANALEAV